MGFVSGFIKIPSALKWVNWDISPNYTEYKMDYFYNCKAILQNELRLFSQNEFNI